MLASPSLAPGTGSVEEMCTAGTQHQSSTGAGREEAQLC